MTDIPKKSSCDPTVIGLFSGKICGRESHDGKKNPWFPLGFPWFSLKLSHLSHWRWHLHPLPSCKWSVAIVQVARGELLHVLVAASVEHMDRFGAFEVRIPLGNRGTGAKSESILMSWGLRIIATSYRNAAGRGLAYQLSTLLTLMRSI